MISECTFDLSLQKVHYYLLFINYRVERSFADALFFSFFFFFWQVHAFFCQNRAFWGHPSGNTTSRSRWTPASAVLLGHLQDDTAPSSSQEGKKKQQWFEFSVSEYFSSLFKPLSVVPKALNVSVLHQKQLSFLDAGFEPLLKPPYLQFSLSFRKKSKFVQRLRNQKGYIYKFYFFFGGWGKHNKGGIQDPFYPSNPSFFFHQGLRSARTSYPSPLHHQCSLTEPGVTPDTGLHSAEA